MIGNMDAVRGSIHLVERNIRGAWVIYGDLGVRQYYYCTKKRAMQECREECARKIVVNRR